MFKEDDSYTKQQYLDEFGLEQILDDYNNIHVTNENLDKINTLIQKFKIHSIKFYLKFNKYIKKKLVPIFNELYSFININVSGNIMEYHSDKYYINNLNETSNEKKIVNVKKDLYNISPINIICENLEIQNIHKLLVNRYINIMVCPKM